MQEIGSSILPSPHYVAMIQMLICIGFELDKNNIKILHVLCINTQFGMPYCFNCDLYDEKMEPVCSDCSATLCSKCEIDDDVLCGCYGKCDECGCDVNRGSDGWRCMDCREWLCNDCKNSSECARCGRGGNGTDNETNNDTDDDDADDTDDDDDDDIEPNNDTDDATHSNGHGVV